jgi:uncharacterized protein YdbL (DUF1318 family)
MNRRNFMAAAGGLALLAAAGAVLADPAQSKALVDAAKAQGVVGEQDDGLLGFVRDSGDNELRGAVAEINAGRSKIYREAAARSGATPEAAGASAFKQVVEPKLKPGDFVRRNGAWSKL